MHDDDMRPMPEPPKPPPATPLAIIIAAFVPAVIFTDGALKWVLLSLQVGFLIIQVVLLVRYLRASRRWRKDLDAWSEESRLRHEERMERLLRGDLT